MDSGLLAIWVQAIGTISTIGVGAWSIRWQVRRQWLAHSAALLMSLEEQFRSKELIEGRRALAHKIQVEIRKSSQGSALPGYWPALSFFDDLGAMVHRKAIDEELVWDRFNWRITRCYIALKGETNLLENTRTFYKEPFMYSRFEWLAERMLECYKSKGISINRDSAAAEYIEQESALFSNREQLSSGESC